MPKLSRRTVLKGGVGLIAGGVGLIAGGVGLTAGGVGLTALPWPGRRHPRPTFHALLRQWHAPHSVLEACRSLPRDPLAAWNALPYPGLVVWTGLAMGLPAGLVGGALCEAVTREAGVRRLPQAMTRSVARVLDGARSGDRAWATCALAAGEASEQDSRWAAPLLRLFEVLGAHHLVRPLVAVHPELPDPPLAALLRAGLPEAEVRRALTR